MKTASSAALAGARPKLLALDSGSRSRPLAIRISLAMVVLGVFAAGPLRGSEPPAPPADPFQEALLRLIAQAAREGKRVTLNRTRLLSGEIPLRPFGVSQPAATSITALEIKEGESAPGPAMESLLRSQEAVLAALDAVCRGQEGLGGKITRLTRQNDGMNREMQDLAAGVGEVREGVSGNAGLTADVAALETDNASLLAALAAQVKALNQTVGELVSGMGALGPEVLALLAAAEEKGAASNGKSEGAEKGGSAAGEGAASAAAAEGAPAREATGEESTSGGEE